MSVGAGLGCRPRQLLLLSVESIVVELMKERALLGGRERSLARRPTCLEGHIRVPPPLLLVELVSYTREPLVRGLVQRLPWLSVGTRELSQPLSCLERSGDAGPSEVLVGDQLRVSWMLPLQLPALLKGLKIPWLRLVVLHRGPCRAHESGGGILRRKCASRLLAEGL